nr:hypothetical protein [Candidatus Levybacteria bacterium]
MRNIFLWIIDYLYLMIGQLQMIVYANPPKNYSKSMQGKIPIIILPGILEKWSFMKSLTDTLSLKGYPIYIVSELKYNLYDIPKSAKIIKDFMTKKGLSNAIFICHSKGGLIGKYFLIHENSDNRIKKIIAISTPFSGSASAKLIPHRAYKELNNESKAIKDLLINDIENKKIVSIYPEFDNHIWSKNGSYLEGAKNIQIKVSGHHKILFTKETINTVIKEAEEL